MPEINQPEPDIKAKVETPAAKSVVAGVLRTDTSYFNEVSRHFNAAREIARQVEDPNEENSYELFLAEQQRTLGKLANPRLADRVTPQEVSLALSDLAGNMAFDNPDIESNRTDDPKQNAENEKRYLESKKLFMETAAKIFPDTEPDFMQLSSVSEILRESTNSALLHPEISVREVEKFLHDNPKELARRIDDDLYFAGHKMKSDAWIAYPSKDRSAQETKLATASEALYKLQLMRDELQKRMYRQADMSPSDARKIDTIRTEVKAVGMGVVTGKEQKDELGEAALRDKKIEFGTNGPFAALYVEHKSPEEVKKAVTPEMKRLLLESMLQSIDVSNIGAEEYVRKNPDVILNRKGVAQFIGIGVATGEPSVVYQKIAVAAEGRVISPSEIARMSMVDYLKRYLGYDLRADKKRTELLEKLTNAFL